jgi:hypothetical protein
MDILDKFLNQVSYKFPKGYPDMNSPEDVLLLKRLVEEYTKEEVSLIKEGSEVYDTTIKKALGVDEVPRSKNKYEFPGKGGSTFSIQVKEDDKDVWEKLYNIAPPKKGEEEGETKGVGNGEIALYWLYNFSNSGVNVEEGREGDDPDLYFDGVGVEVKAYGKPVIPIGRFGADKDNLALLSVVLGINALSKALGGGDLARTINPTNFKGEDLIPAFDQVLELEKIDDLGGLAAKYPIFKTLKDNLDYINKELDNPDTSKDAAMEMVFKLLDAKLGRKPGDGGFFVDLDKSGKVIFYSIDLNKLRTSEDLLSSFSAKQSALVLNFAKIFG